MPFGSSIALTDEFSKLAFAFSMTNFVFAAYTLFILFVSTLCVADLLEYAAVGRLCC